MTKAREHLGVRVDDYRAGVKRGVSIASAQGFSCVEVGIDGGSIEGERLSESGRQHVARLVRNAGLAFASVAQAGATRGLADAAGVDSAIASASDALILAADMGVPIVAHDAGELLELTDGDRARAVEALRVLAAQAERVGTIYALRSAMCIPADLQSMVDEVACPLVQVAVDPGALLMAGFDPIEALGAYGDRVALAYARDATRGTTHAAGQECALGRGRLDLDAYLAGLAAAGYAGAPILRRAQPTSPAEDIAADKAALGNHLIL